MYCTNSIITRKPVTFFAVYRSILVRQSVKNKEECDDRQCKLVQKILYPHVLINASVIMKLV